MTDVETYDHEWVYVAVNKGGQIVCISTDIEDVLRAISEGDRVARVTSGKRFNEMEFIDVSLPPMPTEDECIRLSELRNQNVEPNVKDTTDGGMGLFVCDPRSFAIFEKTKATSIDVPIVNYNDVVVRKVVGFLEHLRAQRCTSVEWEQDSRIANAELRTMCANGGMHLLHEELLLVQRDHALYAKACSKSMLNRCAADRTFVATTNDPSFEKDAYTYIRPGITWPFIRAVKKIRHDRAVADINVKMHENKVDTGHAALLMFWRAHDGEMVAMVYDSYGMYGSNYDALVYPIKHVLHRAGVKLLIPKIRGTMYTKKQLKVERGYCGAYCLLMADLFIRFKELSPPVLAQILSVVLADPHQCLHAIRCYSNNIIFRLQTDEMMKLIIETSRLTSIRS
jgi:hypothetical protein